MSTTVTPVCIFFVLRALLAGQARAQGPVGVRADAVAMCRLAEMFWCASILLSALLRELYGRETKGDQRRACWLRGCGQACSGDAVHKVLVEMYEKINKGSI